MVDIRGVEKDEVVGTAQAKALQDAEIKVISNSGNVNSGVTGVMDLLSSKGGTELGAMAEAFAQTDRGAAILRRLGLDTEPATAEVTVAPRKSKTASTKS